MNQFSTKTARGGKYPRDLSRRAQLQSQTLRSQEYDERPTEQGLAALAAHAEAWAKAKRAGGHFVVISGFRTFRLEANGTQLIFCNTRRTSPKVKATTQSARLLLDRERAA
jgi:hypothetical protein